MLKDCFGRTIDYMRVSVTDRCNLRCGYCMPDGDQKAPHRSGELPPQAAEGRSASPLMTLDEIAFVCEQAAALGIDRFKLTGGEPLTREGCAELVSRLKRIPGLRQVTLTTNGVLLAPRLDALIEAGLDAVNISLDALDRAQYAAITGVDALDQVLSAIDAAAGRLPVKLNCVVQAGVNEDAPPALAEMAKERPVDVRFIEMMPLGAGRRLKTVPNADILSMLEARYGKSAPDERVHGNGPAVYRRFEGFRGSVGFISAVNGPFCERCNRLRLMSTGELKPCLCYGESIPLRDILRDGAPDREGRVRERIREAVRMKPRMHCFETPQDVTERRGMAQIGG